MKNVFFITLIAVVLATGSGAVVALPHAHADGFGITPPYVTNNELTQNSWYQTTILLVRGDPTDDLQANVTINVPGAQNWISIDKGTQFTMPAGSQEVPMVVSVNVPSNAKLGSYTGNIQVVVSPLAGPAKGTVGVTIGAQIDVNLTVVSGKAANLQVKRVTMTNTEAGSSFLWMHFPGKISFTMDVNNTGNIPGAPEKVVFQYEEYLSGNILETEQNSNSLSSVDPFDTKSVVAEMPTYLPQGSYRVFYQIYGNGDAVIGQGTLDLSVLPPGSLTGYIGYGFWGIRWSEKLITFGVIFLFLVILYGIYLGIRWMVKKGRRHRGVLSAPPPPPPRPPHYR